MRSKRLKGSVILKEAGRPRLSPERSELPVHYSYRKELNRFFACAQNDSEGIQNDSEQSVLNDVKKVEKIEIQ